ncbi:helix-turn-helix transcriptional regulator [Lacticaseibacillus mingshuiensis]|uniref:Helix-turn-helix transcriptional regulator n=1 Tax=Lacticaseibacillus mingshuiensis TaxID=2799574 RepID=A0ABW4CJN4_9LACO|nr:helix-turn-helix transcriptional regulator [Lacticaseibacillus mingshuiensis]
MKASDLVREYRKRARMSQVDLADISGVPQTTISAIERGTDPSWNTLKRLAITLNITVEDLMGTEVKN